MELQVRIKESVAFVNHKLQDKLFVWKNALKAMPASPCSSDEVSHLLEHSLHAVAAETLCTQTHSVVVIVVSIPKLLRQRCLRNWRCQL